MWLVEFCSNVSTHILNLPITHHPHTGGPKQKQTNEKQTGAAYLTEYFKAEGVNTALCVVPCGIDGTLSNQFVETTVGFHTACQVRTGWRTGWLFGGQGAAAGRPPRPSDPCA